MSQDDDALLRYPAAANKASIYSHSSIHGLRVHNCHFLRQSSALLMQGYFHNDVIFVANKNVIFYHEDAFVDWQEVRKDITKFFDGACFFIL